MQLLASRGIPCKMLLRKPVPPGPAPTELTAKSTKEETSAFLASLPNVDVVEGDVSNADSMKELLDDCTSCLALFGATRTSKISDIWTNPEENDPTHAKNINYRGVANIIEAAKASKKCKRIVRITGKGESPNSLFSVLINLLGGMAKAWNYQGELLLRDQDDVDYTIIRPGVMSEEGPTGKVLTLADDGGDLPVAKIRYADIASLCVECLAYPNAARSTLTAMTTDEGEGEASYETLLASVQSDRRVFPTDMLEQSRAAVKKAAIGLAVGALFFFSIVVRSFLSILF